MWPRIKKEKKKKKEKSRLTANGYGNWQGINGYKGGFDLPSIFF